MASFKQEYERLKKEYAKKKATKKKLGRPKGSKNKTNDKKAIEHLRKAVSELRIYRGKSKELDVKDYTDKVISRIENEITNIRELL